MARPDHPDREENGGGSSAAYSVAGIPVVDLNILANGDADQRKEEIQHLGRACADWGFFMVINHGVPESLQGATMDACKELFSLPTEEKAEYMEAGPMDPIRVGTGFNSAVDGVRYWRNYLKMFAHPELHCPAKPAYLREIAAEYAARTRGLTLELTTAVSESLGLDGSRIAEALNLDKCLQILIGNHYPPAGPDIGAIGLPTHSDHGLFTLLFQNGVNGLQVKHGGEWLLAKPIPGSFFVIVGDQLEIVSNGRYRAVLHRALVDGKQARMSFLSLIGPCLETVVEPIPELAQEASRGAKFGGIKYREYMEHQQSNKLRENAALDIVRVQRGILARQVSMNNSPINV
ncbi:2-oxoglutarate-dependent dioxygenase 19-like [Lolium rigidum]|uniref:2-oxoglutarate-dependent dioxygenase 19-like n=1 Tax=Lolium rigidum TaxID=89674 RepID=UPI001F5C95C6|nr:2-oxoglutarate-dependent dioxygenase 19-like [Lolium rigidum]